MHEPPPMSPREARAWRLFGWALFLGALGLLGWWLWWNRGFFEFLWALSHSRG